jgi:hypothetical protein
METATIIAIVGGVGGICMSGIGIVTFWMRFSDRITTAKATADKAKDIAEEAKKDAHEAFEKNAILAASFGLYREQVAKEYIHREAMREVEDRLTAAIDRLGARLDRFTEAAMHKN